MIAGDARERRPVDAGRRHPLLGIGHHSARTLEVTGSRRQPQLIELGSAFGIESLNGKHRDVAVLRIDPARRGVRCAQSDGHDQDARTPAETHSRRVLYRSPRSRRGGN